MGRRILQTTALLGIWLFSLCVAASPADRDGIYAKVIRVDQANREVEVAFVAIPKETRVTFVADAEGISEGDYIKLKLDGVKCKIGKADGTTRRVIWKF